MKDPNNPDSSTTIMAKREEKISNCVKKSSELSLLVNIASTKEKPCIYFDVTIHEDLQRWIKHNKDQTIDLEVGISAMINQKIKT